MSATAGISPSDPPAPDTWVSALSGEGERREDALARLHDLLLRAARFEVARSGRVVGGSRAGEGDDLAMQAADDALLAILGKLHSFRGDSRFTTWARKFAVLEARAKIRRRAWHGREIDLDSESWAHLADRRSSPEADLETAELLSSISLAIAEVLSDRQRMVLTVVTLDDVPIDVLADRLSTTRGALYKILHDARKKLRVRLADQGLVPA